MIITRQARLLERLRLPNLTVRGRLVLLYGTVSFVSGLVLLAITFFLVDRALPIAFLRGNVTLPVIQRYPVHLSLPANITASANPALAPAVRQAVQHLQALLGAAPNGPSSVGITVGPAIRVSSTAAVALFKRQRAADLDQFLVGAGIALALMTVASVILGRFVAGRILRPLRTITEATQLISEESLDRRLSLGGPRDELRHLSDTIDDLLGRLEAAFASERTFVANAAHELRTPLAVERSILQVALADPELTVASLRQACEEALEAGRHQEELIDALLTLARSQRGLDHSEPVDLAETAGKVVGLRSHGEPGPVVSLQLLGPGPYVVSGDQHLLERMMSNLVDNALRYNVAGGTVEVRVRAEPAATHLEVENTGPPVPPDEIPRLLRPFQRLARERTGSGQSIGLGLSIVEAIARAHRAELSVLARDQGGLIVTVTFRPSSRLATATGPQERPGGASRPFPGGSSS